MHLHAIGTGFLQLHAGEVSHHVGLQVARGVIVREEREAKMLEQAGVPRRNLLLAAPEDAARVLAERLLAGPTRSPSLTRRD